MRAQIRICSYLLTVIKRTMVEECESVEVSTSNSYSDNELVFVKKSRVKSVIWSYFGVKGDESRKPVKEDINKPVYKLYKN